MKKERAFCASAAEEQSEGIMETFVYVFLEGIVLSGSVSKGNSVSMVQGVPPIQAPGDVNVFPHIYRRRQELRIKSRMLYLHKRRAVFKWIQEPMYSFSLLLLVSPRAALQKHRAFLIHFSNVESEIMYYQPRVPGPVNGIPEPDHHTSADLVMLGEYQEEKIIRGRNIWNGTWA